VSALGQKDRTLRGRVSWFAAQRLERLDRFANQIANQLRGTAQYQTSQDGNNENTEREHTLTYWTAQVGMRILELENRCTCKRTVGSNPTLFANN
jgi:type II secretory pathway component PulJ